MSYDNNSFGGGDRPGFTEQTGSFSNGGGYGQQTQGQSQQSQGGYGQSGGGQSSGGYSGGGGGGGGGYNSGNRGNYGGGGGGGGYGGGGGGYRGGNGGGGFKGGGGGGFQKKPMTPEQLAALVLPKNGIILSGNFDAPENIMPAIRELGEIILNAGYAIRASSMNGFDKMVMQAFPQAEFHIPWKGFGDCQNPKSSFDSEQCKEFAKRYLPEWNNIKETQQPFWGKNSRLVMGKNLDSLARAAVIWSNDGVEGSSNRSQRSGQAGHIAALCEACGIPVININNPNAAQRLRNLIEGGQRHG